MPKGSIDGFLGKKVTRREFIEKGVKGAVALGAALALANPFFRFSDLFVSKEARVGLGHNVREAMFYDKVGANVHCRLCPNSCVLSPGARGICRTRENVDGKLCTFSFGNPCSVHVDPVEKKPLFHFLPATTAFSIATGGCTFRCLNCQNWQISQFRPEETDSIELPPENVVLAAHQAGSASIAYTYSEPTAFYDYMLETSKIARINGIRNLWITNGYINQEPLVELCKALDAANVDLKFFNDTRYGEVCSGSLQPVLSTLKTLKKQGVWFEITNLVIPGLNDNMGEIGEMCGWLYKNLGPDYPLHFSRFHPDHKLTHIPPTPVGALEAARKAAMDAGLKHVYIGNAPGHTAQNTYCPKDGKVCIGRQGYSVDLSNFEDGACKSCGESIAGVWT